MYSLSVGQGAGRIRSVYVSLLLYVGFLLRRRCVRRVGQESEENGEAA
jgi:hypothetical protein